MGCSLQALVRCFINQREHNYSTDSTFISHSSSIPLPGIKIFSGNVPREQYSEKSIHPSKTKAVLSTAASTRASTSGLKAGSIPGPSLREVKEMLGVSGKKIFIL